jgi:hypothetical protein
MKSLLNFYALYQRSILIIIAVLLTAGAFAFSIVFGLIVGYLLLVILIATWKRLPS